MTRTHPLFVVGSGRSGTASFARMLDGVEGIEAHHEYCNPFVQETAALYSMEMLDRRSIDERIERIYASALHYCDKPLWVDSSQKLSWLVGPLAERFPEARFLHVVRDGRKVASSFFHKLVKEYDNDDSYADAAVAVIISWLAGDGPCPPPEKQFLWKVPVPGQPFFHEFRVWNRFQRCAYHWWETNRAALDAFAELPDGRYRTVRIEDLTADEELFASTMTWAGVPYSPELFDYVQTPRHVLVPIDFGLTDEQLGEFSAIAGPMMDTLGYRGSATYEVVYGEYKP